jgi:hypothetical protein
MKTTKMRAVGILILICFTATLIIAINSCQKNFREAGSMDPAPSTYCVGIVTGTAPGDNQVCCVNLKKGSVVCIPCATIGGCNGIWEGTRRNRLNSGVCTIVVEIVNDDDCKTCPDDGRILSTTADANGLFWQFKKKE